MANIINFPIHTTITMTMTTLYAMVMPWKKHEPKKNVQNCIIIMNKKTRNHNVQHYTYAHKMNRMTGHPEK